MKLYREITPLRESDVFVVMDSWNKGFDYPIHYHAEYELTLVLNSAGSRIVGDSYEKYKDRDLVLLGPYLFHKWDDEDMPDAAERDCRVITVQFDMHLFDNSFLGKQPFEKLQSLLRRSRRGVHFSGIVVDRAADIMDQLTKVSGLVAVTTFIHLLDLLSNTRQYRILASEGFEWDSLQATSKRLHAAYQFIIRSFTNPDLRMRDVAAHLNMSESAFSHFFLKASNRSFTQFLLEMRIGYACRLLQTTDDLIKEIAVIAGFNNLTNFNRQFKKARHCTPLEYRKLYQEKADFNWDDLEISGQFVPEGSEVMSNFIPDYYPTTLIHS